MEWCQQNGELGSVEFSLINVRKQSETRWKTSQELWKQSNSQNLLEHIEHSIRKIPEPRGRTFFLTLTSPLTWRVKSWSIMGGSTLPSCLQQTRLITKTLMQCSNLFGAAQRLMSVSPKPRLKLKSSQNSSLLLQGRYIYGARDMGVRVGT